MKKLLNFFLEIEKLKTMPRTGWVLAGVKDPETIAEHTFRLAILTWLLAEKRNFNVEKAIKIAFSHDIGEVRAGDITPFLYYPRLPKEKEKRKKMLMKWARLSRKEKKEIGRKKFIKEKKALLKLTKPLSPNLRNEFSSLWSEYERGILREGKFVNQLNRIETLIQSIEYFGTEDTAIRTNWWEWVEERVDDKRLLEFLKVIQKKFYGKVLGGYKKDKELESILDFIVEIGKLKKMPRTIWVSMGIENPETVVSHIFAVALMAWVFGQEKKKLNMKKLLKMAICHEIPSVYTGDLITPFSIASAKNRKELKKIFHKWPRFSRKEKRKVFYGDYKKEKKALEKLTSKLKTPLKKEIIQLWEEYKTGSTPEASFLNQVNVCAVLLQALQYKKRNKDLPIDWLWEWAFEKCEDPASLEFIEELKKKFYKNKLFSKTVLSLFRRK